MDRANLSMLDKLEAYESVYVTLAGIRLLAETEVKITESNAWKNALNYIDSAIVDLRELRP